MQPVLLFCWIFLKLLLQSYSADDQWRLGCLKVAESRCFLSLRIIGFLKTSAWESFKSSCCAWISQALMLPNLVPLSVAVFWILNSWLKDWLLGSNWSLLLVLESLRNLILPKLSQCLATSLLMWEVTLPIFNQDKTEVCFQIEDFFWGASAYGIFKQLFQGFLISEFQAFQWPLSPPQKLMTLKFSVLFLSSYLSFFLKIFHILLCSSLLPCVLLTTQQSWPSFFPLCWSCDTNSVHWFKCDIGPSTYCWEPMKSIVMLW